MTTLSCARFEARLAAADDAAMAMADAELAAHAAVCVRCRSFAADLSAIHSAAGALPPLPVPPAVWARLAPQIANERLATTGFRVSPSWLAAAAVLLLAVGAALGTLAAGRGNGIGDGARDGAVAQVAADLEAAEAH